MGRTIYSSDLFISEGHVYTDTEAWLDLLLNSEGDSIEVSNGELMRRWRWTNHRVRAFIRQLRDKDMIYIDTNNHTKTAIFFKRKTIKNHSANHSVFHSVEEPIIKELDDAATHLFTQQITQLSATFIPQIPLEELLTSTKTGLDYNGNPLSADEKAFVGFCLWVRQNLPFVSDPHHLRQIVYREFLSLRFTYKYESREIVDCLMSLENDKEHRKKYSILYNTLINWLKLRHGDRRTKDASAR